MGPGPEEVKLPCAPIAAAGDGDVNTVVVVVAAHISVPVAVHVGVAVAVCYCMVIFVSQHGYGISIEEPPTDYAMASYSRSLHQWHLRPHAAAEIETIDAPELSWLRHAGQTSRHLLPPESHPESARNPPASTRLRP